MVLSIQYSSWAKVEAEGPQGSVLRPLLFLICISDLSENLASNPKLLADDTSIFSVVKSADGSNIDQNNYLKKAGEREFQWKMNFNPDPTKQVQELSKAQMANRPTLFFNQNLVPQTSPQKHLGMFLDKKLILSDHLKIKFS